MTNKQTVTKQLKIVDGNVYTHFGDAPTRTELRQLFNDYLSGNKKVNGSSLALGLADAFEQKAWQQVPWAGYTPRQARYDAKHHPEYYGLVSDDGSDAQ